MKKYFTKEVKIGICVFVALTILFFGINFLKGINLIKGSNYYYTSFSSVNGLSESASVMLHGFKVGQVRDIEIDYDHPGNVKVEIRLDDRLRLPLGSKAVLASDILGTGSITLQLADNPNFIKPGGEIEGVVAAGLMDAVGNNLMPAAEQILPKIDTLLTTVNVLLGDPALRVAIQRLDGITADLRSSTQSIANMTGALEPLPGQLTPLFADAQAITGNVRTMTENLDAASADVSAFTGNLRQMPLDQLVSDLQTTTANLRTLTNELNNPNSSIGLLMRDPALYNNLNAATNSLDSLLIDIKKNPRRYINIRVF